MPGEAAKNRIVASLTVNRLSPEIYTAEGDSFDDIVADLEERYLGYERPEGLRRELAVPAESGQEYRLD